MLHVSGGVALQEQQLCFPPVLGDGESQTLHRSTAKLGRVFGEKDFSLLFCSDELPPGLAEGFRHLQDPRGFFLLLQSLVRLKSGAVSRLFWGFKIHCLAYSGGKLSSP